MEQPLTPHFYLILTKCTGGYNIYEEVKCWEFFTQDLSKKNFVTLPCTPFLLVSAIKEFCQIDICQIVLWTISWQVIGADTVKNYTGCHCMDAFILTFRSYIMDSHCPKNVCQSLLEWCISWSYPGTTHIYGAYLQAYKI